MSLNDPFGRPPGGGNPFPGGYPSGGHGPRRRRVLGGSLLAGFIAFDVVVLLIVGLLFVSGVFGGGDSGSGAVIIPPDPASAVADDDDDDDDDLTTVVTRETGTSTIIDDDEVQAADIDDAAAGPAPSGINATSMIRASNLRPAIADLKGLAPGRVLMLSLHPTHVTAQVQTSGGALKTVVDHFDQPAQVLSTTPGAASGREGVAWSTIDPSAPERLVKASHAGNASVSHLVVMPALSPWALHLKSGKRIPADAKGNPTS